ncbi:DUF4974 domain-containing protein [Flavivirga amylovorans]|uniref:DUF4974 domain-containing protein n=1 Tax=Flavivirga amylovorans TaxID=870486 RepID=A0ABT8X4M2_9FLAO|nr:FecR domain-containing protein [Flavivirga amylovorans]MDO5988918.1 DUF4974 domain-containing protein [Flavivirga amylovorans]
MEQNQIDALIVKFVENNISDDEFIVLKNWLEISNNKTYFDEYIKINYLININTPFNSESSLQEIKKHINLEPKNKRRTILKYVAVAASIAFLISLPFLINKSSVNNSSPEIVNSIIEVGTDKATLTLSDGTDIILEKGQNYTTNNASSDGEALIYKSSSKTKSELVYNYLTIPRGGQYFVKLSDGTQVWLNSESKLKYPINFIEGDTRTVELIYGEAYFDVSPSSANNNMAFKVLHHKQHVEVLGTEFNIKAYLDESIVYTTLVEGKVAIDNFSNKTILTPNQQSQIGLSRNIKITDVDVDDETSWKRGVFNFKNKSLKEIAIVLERWYDIDILFIDKSIKDRRFLGSIDKNQSIEDILSLIKMTGQINTYNIEGKIIILK